MRDVGRLLPRLPRRPGHRRDHSGRHLGARLPADSRGIDVRDSETAGKDPAGRDETGMSTLTKYSAIPYTGPAPTNREPYVPADAAKHDARGEELATQVANVEQERGQDLPTLVVDKNNIIDVLTSLKPAG